MNDSCAVCAETLEWVAYGECGHRDVCSTCVSRLRFLCEDRRCCICRTKSGNVFATKALGDHTANITNFSIFPKTKKEGKNGDYWFHRDTGAFFDDINHYNTIKAMSKLSCSICDKTDDRKEYNDLEQLNSHLFQKHNKIMCTLCLEGRKVFICEQRLYTRLELDRHIKMGDFELDGIESGFTGHPTCEFCRKPFYGEEELYRHLNRQHYSCSICQRRNPGQYHHYKNYDDLEMHFRSLHFLCEDEACLEKKFVVFTSEYDLEEHRVSEHAGRGSSSLLQIPTIFRYEDSGPRGSGRGRGYRYGRGFHPDPPEEQAPESTNPQILEIDGTIPPLVKSTSTVDSSRYLQAVSSQNSVDNAPLREEASFTALTLAETNTRLSPSNNSFGKSKTARPNAATANATSSSNPWSANNGRIVASSSISVSVPRHVDRDRPSSISSISEFPPVSQPKTVKMEDVFNANKSLEENFQASLKFD